MDLHAELNYIRDHLENLKRTSRLDSSLNCGIDRRNVTITIDLVIRGVQKKVACIYPKDTENISKLVINKITIIMR